MTPPKPQKKRKPTVIPRKDSDCVCGCPEVSHSSSGCCENDEECGCTTFEPEAL